MDLAAVEAQTAQMVEAGHKVFQIHRFARDEKSHVARLERWAELPHGASVIDLGCGTGEVARIISAIRPDLNFCLVNISSVQLGYAPPEMKRISCDFRNVPEPAASFDAAMFCFSIGHAPLFESLQEAARLLKSGGVLFVYDMVRISGSNESMRSVEYEVHSRESFESAANDCGFKFDFYMEPQDDGSYGAAVLGDEFHYVFDGTIPAIWRFVKC